MRPSSDNLEKLHICRPSTGSSTNLRVQEGAKASQLEGECEGIVHVSGCSGAVMVLTSDNQALPSYGL